jgi:hypothetical protein
VMRRTSGRSRSAQTLVLLIEHVGDAVE